MADNTELLIRIRADVKQALDEIKNVRGGLEGAGAAGKGAATGLEQAGGAAGRTGRKLNTTATAGEKAGAGLDSTGTGAHRAGKGLDRTSAAAGKTRRKLDTVRSSGSATAKVFRDLRRTFVLAFAAHEVIRFTGAIVQANLEAQRIHYTLESVTGSAAGANREFKFLTDLSQRLGLDLKTTAAGYSRLAVSAKSAGISNAELRKGFVGLADAFTVLHTPAEDVQGLLVQIEQGLSLGKLQMQDFRAIAQHLPGTFELVKQAVAGTGQSLQELLKNGGVPAKQFFQSFTQLLRDKYGPEAKKASDGLNGSLNRLHTTIFGLETQPSGFVESFTGAIKNLNTQLQDPSIQQGLTSLIGLLGRITNGAVRAAAEIGHFYTGLRVAAGLGGGNKLVDLDDKVRRLKKDILDLQNTPNTTMGVLGTVNYQPQAKKDNRLASLREQLRQTQAEYQATLTKGRSVTNALDRLNKVGIQLGSKKKQPFSLLRPDRPLIFPRDGTPHNDTSAADFLKNHPGSDDNGTNDTGPSAAEQAAQRRADSIASVIAALKQQSDTYGQTSNQIDLYRLKTLGATQEQQQQAQALVDSIAQQKADTQAKTEAAAAAEKAAQQQAAFVEQIKNEIDPARQYRAQLVALDAAYADGKVSAEQYAQAAALIGHQIKHAGNATQDASGQLDQFRIQAARNIQDVLANAFQFNKLDDGLKGLVHNFANAMEQIAAQALALNLSEKLFGDGFATGKQGANIGGLIGKGIGALSGLFGGGAAAGSEASAIASLFHSGGTVGAGAPMSRSVPLSAFMGAPRFHSGSGVLGLAPDEVPAILQSGEQVLSRQQVASQGAGSPGSLKVLLYDDRQRMLEALSGPEAEKIMVQHVTRNADQVSHALGSS